MSYTLGEAAKAAGRTKPTILRAIHKSKISAVKDEATGTWVIDPAELHRVYPPASLEVTPKPTTENGTSYNALHIEVTLLRERVTAQETLYRERLEHKEATLSDMREERDNWRTQAQTLLLSPPASTKTARKWRLFGR